MEGFPCRKFFIFWKGARFQGPSSGFLLAGTWSVPLSGTRGSGSCLEAGGNDTGDPVPLVFDRSSTQAGTHSEPRCVQAGESRRDDTGNGFLKISLVLRVPRTEGIDISRSNYSLGKDTIEQLLELHLERRVMSGSKGDEALAEYKKALEAMSARKAAIKRTAPVEDEEVQFVGSSSRQATADVAPSSSKKKSKASGSVPKTPSLAPFDWSAVLSNLIAKAFPLVPARLSLDGDSFAAIRSLQGGVSTIPSWGEDALTAQLREGKDAVLAKEKEIKALKLKVQNQEEAMERVATENASLQKQLEGKEEDICELKYAVEVFDAEKAMAVNGAKVVARWELMREWLHHQTDSWEPAAALEQYKTVKTIEAELLGLPAPCFDDEPQVPERDGAPEPADDPPTNLPSCSRTLTPGKDVVLAKEKEIKALKLKVQNQEEAMERVATENASLQKQLEGKEEDICKLKYAAEVFDAEKAMAINGAKVVAQWELMREWLHHQTDSWEPAAALEQYKTVKTTEAELLGLPAPCFDDEPQVPKRDGAPEPADDPPTN
ncbi:hypothetical protein DY000_02040187 [Brassica cretica]|uniref:Chromo domain-containing protein n=1 Tax=Brassica cretica TaxID=69181 RepID=A0ABQ7BK93_BRACR|nr:hypothetical protein DY000_02040187 [Brassica cretica]